MENIRLTFGESANFEGCLEVLRVNIDTEKCDFLRRSAELVLNEPTIGEYFAALTESGWIHPADSEVYSRFFELSRIKERLENGRLILNSIRVKPADAYIWTDFEFVCPKSCPRSVFVFIRDLKRAGCPALNGYRLLMRSDIAGKEVYPIIMPFGNFKDFREALRAYVGSFGLDFPSFGGEAQRQIYRADGFTLEFARDTSGLLAAVYENGAVSEERQREVLDYCGKIDAETGMYTERCVKTHADISEDEFIGAMLIKAKGSAHGKALWILKRDFAGCSFARGDGQLAAVLTGSESRLRHDFGALCRRLSDTGGDFVIKLSLSAVPTSAEEVLKAAAESMPQTPRDFRWSAAGTARQDLRNDEESENRGAAMKNTP